MQTLKDVAMLPSPQVVDQGQVATTLANFKKELEDAIALSKEDADKNLRLLEKIKKAQVKISDKP